ncbi:MAG: hypothetical protein J5674_02380 [Candidatus Methanomethylophilaceae archaeon]|nr:hypothetical protein [Candidatus Methanomethylophilaceae archaeon]
MNARLDYRETSRSKLIETIVYNELLLRGCDVEVGRADFVVNRSFDRAYTQVAMGVDDPGKME